MSDRPTPLTDAVQHQYERFGAAIGSSVPHSALQLARALERQLAEAKEAMQSADTLLAKLGYQPTDLTRAKLAQHLTP